MKFAILYMFAWGTAWLKESYGYVLYVATHDFLCPLPVHYPTKDLQRKLGLLILAKIFYHFV